MNEMVKGCRIQRKTTSLLVCSNSNSEKTIRNRNVCIQGISQTLLAYSLWTASKWASQISINMLFLDLG